MNEISNLPQPRRRFQLHLSTCVLLMLVAGALLWLNIRDCEVESRISAVHWIMQGRGYPFIFAEWSLEGSKFPYERFRWHYLTINLSIALAVLAVIYFLSEGIVRRLDRTRTPEPPPHA